MLESDIEQSLVKYAKRHGVYTRKFVSPANTGVPDRVFLCEGNMLFMELKRPGSKPTKKQVYEMKQINKERIPVCWVDDAKAGKKVLWRLAYNNNFYGWLQESVTPTLQYVLPE